MNLDYTTIAARVSAGERTPAIVADHPLATAALIREIRRIEGAGAPRGPAAGSGGRPKGTKKRRNKVSEETL